MATVETLFDFVEEGKSPGLVQVTITSVHRTPSPSTTETAPSASDGESEREGNNEPHIPGSLGDAVLWRQSAPDYPHVASQALKYSLPPPEKAVAPSSQHMISNAREGAHEGVLISRDAAPAYSNKAKAMWEPRATSHDTATSTGTMDGICRIVDKSSIHDDYNSPETHHHSPSMPPEKCTSSPARKKPCYNTKPPPLGPVAPESRQKADAHASNANLQDNTLAKSAVLAKYAIDGRHAEPNTTLAALQASSPPALSATFPEAKACILPSLTTALGVDKGSPFPSGSPHLSRTTSSQFGTPLTAVSSHSSALSPSGWPANHASTSLSSFITSRGRANSASTPSDLASASTPGLTWSAHSPAASVHTPYSTTSPVNLPRIPPSRTEHPSFPPPLRQLDSHHQASDLQSPGSPPTEHYPGNHVQMHSHSANSSISSLTASTAIGNFHCTMPDCNAPPFQTQYLLNSHMNVHSDQRPHFCPVKHCPRGPGGQGFKRKNEMIRHGLVHTSPGYTCPFCADQQHRYPRPDNLQRHVRVHHVDRDRDDPLLREVLSQRPEGGARGRRRRANA